MKKKKHKKKKNRGTLKETDAASSQKEAEREKIMKQLEALGYIG